MVYLPPCLWKSIYEFDSTYHDYFRRHIVPYLHTFRVYKIDRDKEEDDNANYEDQEDQEDNMNANDSYSSSSSYLIIPPKSYWAVGEEPEFALLLVDHLEDPIVFIAQHFTTEPYTLFFEQAAPCRMVPRRIVDDIFAAYSSI